MLCISCDDKKSGTGPEGRQASFVVSTGNSSPRFVSLLLPNAILPACLCHRGLRDQAQQPRGKRALAPESIPAPLSLAAAGMQGRQSSPGYPTARRQHKWLQRVCPCASLSQGKCVPPRHVHWKHRPTPSLVLRSLATLTKEANIQAEHTA